MNGDPIKSSPVWLTAHAAVVLLFLTAPVAIVIPMAFSSASSLTFPPPGFSFRWFETLFYDSGWRAAALNSLFVALISSTVAVLLGGFAAYGIARNRFIFRHLIEGNFVAPLILPPVALSVALYIVFAKIGLLGTFTGIILGHTVLCAPYVVILLGVAIRGFDERFEQVAATLGASKPRILFQIMAPNLWPSILASWLFAFITSFDEVIVTIFVAGSHMTIPKKMFNELIIQINPTITAVATLLIAFSILILAIVGLLVGRRATQR